MGGIIFCYLLLKVVPVEGKTMNAVMTKRFIGSLSLQSLAKVALFLLKVFVLDCVVVEQHVVNVDEKDEPVC